MLVPRKVGFNSNGIAIGAGFNSQVEAAPQHVMMMLPSKGHYDFIDFDVRGKTEQQIKDEVSALYPTH